MDIVRTAVLQTLIKLDKNNGYSNIQVNNTINHYNLIGADRSLYTALVYGVVSRRLGIDYILNQFSKIKTEKLERCVLEILRMGVYQIMYADKIPDSAACNESVKLSRENGCARSSGFINGVLRNIARQKDNIKYPEDTTQKLSVIHSLSPWIIEQWIRDYGEEHAEALCKAINNDPNITLRVNTLKISTDELVNRLKQDGIDCRKSDTSQYGIKLNQKIPYETLENNYFGLFYVQDEASQLSTVVLDAQAGDKILDCCACPGGKSFGAGLTMGNKGIIHSCDIHESKLSLISTKAKDLGIDCITTEKRDASKDSSEYYNSYDKIICDVPCSGLGVMWKKPELRYKNKTEADNLPELQYKILSNCFKYLRVGGTLVYSTCTLSKGENENNINKFLSENTCCSLCSDIILPQGMITLFPDINGTDGFFIAKLTKNKE